MRHAARRPGRPGPGSTSASTCQASMRSATGPRRRSVRAGGELAAGQRRRSELDRRARDRQPHALGVSAPAGGRQGRRGPPRRAQLRAPRHPGGDPPPPAPGRRRGRRRPHGAERRTSAGSAARARARPARRRPAASGGSLRGGRRGRRGSRRLHSACACSKRRQRLGSQAGGSRGLRPDQRQFRPRVGGGYVARRTASSRARHSGRSPRISATRANSQSIAVAAAVAPSSVNSSRARTRSRSRGGGVAALGEQPAAVAQQPRLPDACRPGAAGSRARGRSAPAARSPCRRTRAPRCGTPQSEPARAGRVPRRRGRARAVAAAIAPRPARSSARRRRASAVRRVTPWRSPVRTARRIVRIACGSPSSC